VRRPLSQLLDFKRLAIPRGGSASVELRAQARDFEFWNVRTGAWFREAGDWELRVGPSSAESRLRIPISVEGEALPPRELGGWIAASAFDRQEGAIIDRCPSGESVRPAEGRDSCLLSFDDADFGPGGDYEAEFQCYVDRPGARLALSAEGAGSLSLESPGGGELILRGNQRFLPGRRGFELGLQQGLRLLSFRFRRG
jgi:beta-glucosidase